MSFNLKPIGFVKNTTDNRSDMTMSGTESTIEINSEFSSALESLEENSHLIVCCFLHCAKRDVQTVHPRKFNIYSLSEKGVFATRSPDRPNPISVSVVKLLKRNINTLFVDKLDVINGTPVIDIKPYIPDSDGVFNSQRLNVKTSLTNENEQYYYDFLKESVLRYIFTPDNHLDLGIYSLIKIVQTLKEMPDRTTVRYIETDFTGNALDCIYYHFKMTPGENKIKVKEDNEKNSFLKIYFTTGETWEIRNASDKTSCTLKSLEMNRINL